MTTKKDNDSILRSASLMGIATFMSRILGLVREQVFAFLFGAGNVTDAFQVAFRIPNLLRDLFAEGAMSAALVPTFTQTRVKEGDRRAWRVAGLVFRVLFVCVSIIAILGIVFAPELVSLYAEDFKKIPGKFELTVRLTQILFPFFPLVALAAAFMGILNACGVFFLPAFASALFNLVSICIGAGLSFYLFHYGNQYGIQPIEGMAYGVLAGGFVQAFCQLPQLYKKGYRWQKRLPHEPQWFDDPKLKKMLWLMLPGTLGLAATQLNLLINTILATSQQPGSVSWLGYAFRLMQFPIGVFGVSLASATLPKVSRQVAEKDFEGVSQSLVQSLRNVFALNLPASSAFIFLGIPIIQLIFEYGRFYSDDTRATAQALGMYAIGLTAYSVVKVLVPVCYAFGQTRIAVISSLLSVGVTLAFNLTMVRFTGFWGLALGTSVAAFVNAFFLLGAISLFLRKKNASLPFYQLSLSFLSYASIAFVMGGVCFYSAMLLQKIIPDFYLISKGYGVFTIPIIRFFKVIFLILEGVGCVLGLAYLFKMKEIFDFFDYFNKKMKKKLRPSST